MSRGMYKIHHKTAGINPGMVAERAGFALEREWPVGDHFGVLLVVF